ACACFFLHVIGLPPFTIEVGFPAFARQNDFLTDPFFETAVISLCSGPQVCSPPRSFLPQWLIASGQPGLLSEQNMLRFLRMHRTLLTIRIQAIDGVGTYTHKIRSLVGCSSVWGCFNNQPAVSSSDLSLGSSLFDSNASSWHRHLQRSRKVMV